MNDPVDGLALRLEHVVEAGLDQLAVAVEELAVHVDGLVERVSPRLVQKAHQGQVPAGGRHLTHPVGRGRSNAVEQDPTWGISQSLRIPPAPLCFRAPLKTRVLNPKALLLDCPPDVAEIIVMRHEGAQPDDLATHRR